MVDVSVVILTYNEEVHIERCIKNAQRFAKYIYLVDSFSTDRTIEIAERLGARVYQNPWVNYSTQFNWALKNITFETEWVYRMDADEYFSDALIDEFHAKLPTLDKDINGVTIPCFRVFMGKYIHRGIIPLILLRLFKHKYALCEPRWMDEHMQITEGKIDSFQNQFYDDNLNDISWWTQKHNGYASREAIDLLITEYNLKNSSSSYTGEHSSSVRNNKNRYIKMPLFWRAFLYFVYRYIFKLGFLEGTEGFLWHFLQGWWYRTLADAKVYELKKRFNWDDVALKEYIGTTYVNPDANSLTDSKLRGGGGKS